MSLDDGTRQIQAQAGSLRMLDGFRRSIEPVKDVRQVLRFDPRTLVAHAHDHLLGPHASADLDLAVRGILQRIGHQVGDHLLDARFVADNDGKIRWEIRDQAMLRILRGKAFGHAGGQGWQRYVGLIQAETAGLQTRGIQQIVYHFRQSIRFILYDRQRLADGGLVPTRIVAAQGGGVAFDQRNRRSQLVTDDGDECGLDLIGGAKVRDIAHADNDIAQFIFGR